MKKSAIEPDLHIGTAPLVAVGLNSIRRLSLIEIEPHSGADLVQMG